MYTQLPSLVLPGLAIVAFVALLRLFRNPILRLLGVTPVNNDAMYRQPYGAPYGQVCKAPWLWGLVGTNRMSRGKEASRSAPRGRGPGLRHMAQRDRLS